MLGKNKINRVRPTNGRPRYAKSNLQYYSAGHLRDRGGNDDAPATQTNTKKRRPRLSSAPTQARGYLAKLPYYFSGTVIAASLIYCSILGNKVSVLLPSTGGLHNSDYYQTRLSVQLSSSLFNHSKFTFDPHAFKAKTLQSMPEIADATIRIPFVGKKPVIGITFKEPALLLHANNRNYIISNEGMVLSEAIEVDTSKLDPLIHVQEDVPLKLSVGKPALTKDNVAFIQDVVGELNVASQTIESVTLPLGAGELYVRLKTAPYIIKFASSTNSGAKQQVGAFLAVVNNLKDQPQPSQYIDVRLAERVFVK